MVLYQQHHYPDRLAWRWDCCNVSTSRTQQAHWPFAACLWCLYDDDDDDDVDNDDHDDDNGNGDKDDVIVYLFIFYI